MTPWVKRILLANVAVFFVQLTVSGATTFLAFIPSMPWRVWSFVTYMFAHSTTSITHILFNMLVLYFFGPRVEERLGSSHFVRLYFAAGITGAILSIVFAVVAVGVLIAAVPVLRSALWMRRAERELAPIDAWADDPATTVESGHADLSGRTPHQSNRSPDRSGA